MQVNKQQKDTFFSKTPPSCQSTEVCIKFEAPRRVGWANIFCPIVRRSPNPFVGPENATKAVHQGYPAGALGRPARSTGKHPGTAPPQSAPTKGY